MKITVYTFYKNHNSTKTPSGLGTEITVRLKDGCSILHPKFLITSRSWPETGNYIKATIGGKYRYYYVDDVEYATNSDRFITCSYDYMASNKTMITASSQYVVRTSDTSKAQDRITDNMVMAKNQCVKTTVESSAIYSMNGYYVLGLLFDGITHPITRRGSVSYVAMSKAALVGFINDILTIGTSLMASFSPIQYVVSCVYIPFSLSNVQSETEAVTFGDYHISQFTYDYTSELAASNGVLTVSAGTITMPGHPDAAAYGDYLNYSPYARYKMYAGPFGDFDLPEELILSTLTLSILCDVTDGTAILKIYSGGNVMYARGRVGVDTALSQISSNPLLGVASIAVGAAGSVASLAMGNIFGGVTGLMNAGISAVQNMIPSVHTKGMNGSMCELQETKILVVGEFFRISGDPKDFIGRPCFDVVTISTIASGSFIQCANVKIEIPGYTSEQDEVKRIMEAGFFLE